MSDLTVIFLTANEHPKHFTKYHQEILLRAAKGHEIITVSRKPTKLGKNIIDTGQKSHINMYLQLLNAAKLAKTPYIAVAEDDCLYPEEHFNFFRPPMDSFAYNMHRWSLFTWKPIYSIKQRKSNCTLLAPRELLIEAWEERFKKRSPDHYPPGLVGEVGRPNVDVRLGVTVRKCIEVWSGIGVIQLNHPRGTDSVGRNKKLGEVKAIEIPYWGKASDIVNEYK